MFVLIPHRSKVYSLCMPTHSSSMQKCFTIPAEADGLRVDRFLSQQELGLSRSAVQRLIKDGRALISAKTAKPSDKVKAGQTCCIEISEEVAHPSAGLEAKPMALQILYEDDHILALNKPPGISVHPGAGREDVTLAHGILAHSQAEAWPGERERPGIVHRLDKDTSGVILVAKTEAAHLNLSRQFAERRIEKEYWALTWGAWDRDRVSVDAPIGRSRTDRKKMAVVAGGRAAQTDFQVLARFDFCTEVAAFPHTGRTHQIRVHLAHLHHPVVGDALYGGSFAKRTGSLPALSRDSARSLSVLAGRQLLHARRINLDHPATGKRISFEAPFPPDILRVRECLRNR